MTHTEKRISTADVTNIINELVKKHGIELIIETTVDKAFAVRAFRKQAGNRAMVASASRNCIGDALNEVEKELSAQA